MSWNHFWNLDSLAAHIRGSWIAMPSKLLRTARLNGLSTDSRAVEAGQVFLALKGEKFDGHEFLAQAIARGAAALIVSDAQAWHKVRDARGAERVAVVLVQDTALALLDLAGSYRRSLSAKFVGVGGSNGKTSTVRLLFAALAGQPSPSLRTHSSQRSFNNSVGVPITVLGAPADSECVICELGTNAPGELSPLSELVEPDLAIITSLGREHLEGLGSIEGVAREEASLIRGVRDGGTVVLNADSPELLAAAAEEVDRAAKAGRRVNIITFGNAASADIRVSDVKQSLSGTTFTVTSRVAGQAQRAEFSIPLLGAHNASNATGAIAIARLLGLQDNEIARGLANTTPAPMRLQRIDVQTQTGPIRFVNDAYNANPESMIAAFATFAEVTKSLAGGVSGRGVVVLGDMLELGSNGPTLHREVIAALLKTGVASDIYLVGPIWKSTWESYSPAPATVNVTLIGSLAGQGGMSGADQIARALKPGDCVLLKGSRSMGLERVLASAQRLFTSPSVELKPDAVPVARS
ncbi:MAG: UDP-N-acetylmuramoyl-tripeptide--D-alanyl-D-alanine ligase [Phycisphaerales bacterium]